MVKPLTQTTGRRKGAIARVRIRPGEGKIVVNKRDVANYFPSKAHQMILSEPLRLTSTDEAYDVEATISGGGVSGQAGALRLGIFALPRRILGRAECILPAEVVPVVDVQ